MRDTLLDAGVDVVAFRRAGSPPAATGRSVQVDYSDVAALARFFETERPDFVFHVAGAMNGIKYEDFRQGNLVPTRNLVQALRDSHPSLKRFVYVSSLTAYGPCPKDEPITEKSDPNPVEFYGRSKLEAEEAVQTVGDALPWSIIRPAAVYGPGDYQFLKLCQLASRGLNLFYGNRSRQLSLVYIDDLVDAIIDAALAEAALQKGYFICDGHIYDWEELQREVVRAADRRVWNLDLPEFAIHALGAIGEFASRINGKPSLFNRQKVIMATQDAWTCRHEAASADFGYHPKMPIEEGIRRTFDWYRTHRWL